MRLKILTAGLLVCIAVFTMGTSVPVVLMGAMGWAPVWDRTNNTYFWGIDKTTGALVPGTDSRVDIGTAPREVEDIFVETITVSVTATLPTGGVSAGEIANVTRAVPLPLLGFMVDNNGTPLTLTTSTGPGLEKDNDSLSLVWADSEVTPVMISFRVPDDYASAGALRVFCDENANTTRSQLDFEVHVNTGGSVWGAVEASATGQTPAILAEAAGTPEWVALSVATDFASLAAGQEIVLKLWRDNVATGTNDLEVYYAEFYYTATQ